MGSWVIEGEIISKKRMTWGEISYFELSLAEDPWIGVIKLIQVIKRKTASSL